MGVCSKRSIGLGEGICAVSTSVKWCCLIPASNTSNAWSLGIPNVKCSTVRVMVCSAACARVQTLLSKRENKRTQRAIIVCIVRLVCLYTGFSSSDKPSWRHDTTLGCSHLIADRGDPCAYGGSSSTFSLLTVLTLGAYHPLRAERMSDQPHH